MRALNTAATGMMAAAGVNIAAQYSDHDHRLGLVVDDLAAARKVAAHWARGPTATDAADA